MTANNKTLLSNSVIYLISSLATQAINLFLIPLYTNRLSLTEFGQYDLLNSVQQLLAIGITLGVYSGMIRFFNEVPDQHELKNTSLTFSFIWGAICLTLTLAVNPFLSPLLFGEAQGSGQYIPMIVMNAILSCYVAIYASFYSMQFKALKMSIVQVCTVVFTLIFAIWFVVILELGIVGILRAQLFANAIVFSAVFISDLRHFRFSLRFAQLRKVLHYGMGLMLGNISSWVLDLIDRFFISGMIHLAAVAVYSIGYKIGMLINPVFLTPFKSVFTAFKYKVYKDEDGKQRMKHMFELYIFIGSLYCIIGLSLFAKLAVKLLATDDYLLAIHLVPFIALSYFIFGLGEFYSFGLHIANKMLLISSIEVIAALINIGANFALIPFIGIYGAAASTLIAYFAVNVIFLFTGRRYYDLGITIWYPFKYMILFVPLYAAYLLFDYWVEHMLLEVVFVCGLIGVFMWLSVKLNFIAKEEVKRMTTAVNQQWQKVWIKRRIVREDRGL